MNVETILRASEASSGVISFSVSEVETLKYTCFTAGRPTVVFPAIALKHIRT